ncbi:MAG: hypothetical protein LBO65_06960 [Spirochaetaceae bacterium]|jgi:hypothetical protein|nr:hypothetical protein [Spirochaetaceae bacterium]
MKRKIFFVPVFLAVFFSVGACRNKDENQESSARPGTVQGEFEGSGRTVLNSAAEPATGTINVAGEAKEVFVPTPVPVSIINEEGEYCFPLSMYHRVVKDGHKYTVEYYLPELGWGTGQKRFSFSTGDLKTDPDGFYRIRLEDDPEETIVIRGGVKIFFFPLDGWKKNDQGRWAYWYGVIRCINDRDAGVQDLIKTLEFNEKWTPFQEAVDFVSDCIDVSDGFDRWAFKSVAGSSALSEAGEDGKTLVYGAERLYMRFFETYYADVIEWYSTLNNPPWIVPGEGIGESFIVTFAKPEEALLVLNGYVDPLPQRRSLFKEYNRIKVARILSDKFDFEIFFNDAVELSEIHFPVPADKVQVIIKDVYHGTRHNNTAVTAIMRNTH